MPRSGGRIFADLPRLDSNKPRPEPGLKLIDETPKDQ
jgi:hypothetical protein